jgi:hypothetical protein
MRHKYTEWNLFAGALLMLASMIICALLQGCASTGTVLRLGGYYDVTDKVYGCDRDLDLGCGLKGPRDLALIEVLYAPGLQLRRPIEPFCSWLHNSHFSAGKPFNDRFEQVVDAVGGGAFIQIQDRR